jgi:hypothetical protein
MRMGLATGRGAMFSRNRSARHHAGCRSPAVRSATPGPFICLDSIWAGSGIHKNRAALPLRRVALL